MRSTYTVFIASWFVACAPSADVEKDPDVKPVEGQSEPRLKQRIAETDHGDREVLGWYDSARDERCALREGPDGILRCMPTESVHEISGMSGVDTVAFTDSECAAPVYVSQAPRRGDCGSPLRYVFHAPEATASCSPEYYYVYRIGEEVPFPGVNLYARRESGCSIFRVVDTAIAFSATQVPADSFVKANESLSK